ncbi:MAG: Gfo/Idh/MocA family oxidoreductase [Lentisphaeria bacterium]|nr:Gfo/Idh/MocA family oxidoreductase [Lentisphaeria bacterium]MBO5765114.1 Gfo/Idh/MocA family oxidoreductase [Lentisphaeria bacterium]MBO5992388.1 Gfo/Idh/MocA family oxidoreductase [Lentisphaeria bacterium]
MKKKIIVCGFGFMGQTHAANILNSSDLELAAVVTFESKDSIKPVAGNISTGNFDWKLLDDIPFFTTLAEAFANCECDAVVIASPTAAHASSAIECLNAGKHVFLEKPLCVTANEAKDILAAAEKSNCIFHVGHCLRFFPQYSYLKQVVSENTYGKLKYLKLLRRAGVPVWGAWKDKDTSLKSITGPIYDLNIHDVDFALYLAGEPENLSAVKEAYADKLFKAEWKTACGTLIEIEGGFSDQPAFPFRSGYTAVFENATLECATNAQTPVQLSCGEKCEPVELPDQDGYALEMRAFADALAGKNTAHCTPAEAARALAVCASIVDAI